MKEDLRILRTRKLLCNSLLELLQKKSYEKINVNDICDNAMVHRATFYNHFKDKNDLLNFTLDEIQEDMFEKSIQNNTNTSLIEICLSLISNAFDFFIDNKEKFILIYHNSSEKINLLIANGIKRSIEYLLAKSLYKDEFSIPLDVIINFFTGGFTLLAIDFLQSNKPYTKDEMLEYFKILLLNEKLTLKH